MPRSRTRQQAWAHVTPEVLISERPADADDRAVPGHWEGDLVIGLERSAIAVCARVKPEGGVRLMEESRMQVGDLKDSGDVRVRPSIAPVPVAISGPLGTDSFHLLGVDHDLIAALQRTHHVSVVLPGEPVDDEWRIGDVIGGALAAQGVTDWRNAVDELSLGTAIDSDGSDARLATRFEGFGYGPQLNGPPVETPSATWCAFESEGSQCVVDCVGVEGGEP